MLTKPGTQNSFLQRTCDVVCVFLLIFYVLFDVLDLDGSNICRITIDGHRPVLTSAIESDFRSDDLLESTSALPAPVVDHVLIGHSQEFYTTHTFMPLSPSTRFHSDRGCRSDTETSDVPPDH